MWITLRNLRAILVSLALTALLALLGWLKGDAFMTGLGLLASLLMAVVLALTLLLGRFYPIWDHYDDVPGEGDFPEEDDGTGRCQ